MVPIVAREDNDPPPAVECVRGGGEVVDGSWAFPPQRKARSTRPGLWVRVAADNDDLPRQPVTLSLVNVDSYFVQNGIR